jgi:hypothetical protein
MLLAARTGSKPAMPIGVHAIPWDVLFFKIVCGFSGDGWIRGPLAQEMSGILPTDNAGSLFSLKLLGSTEIFRSRWFMTIASG